MRMKDLMEKVMVTGTGKNVKEIYIENGIYTTGTKDRNGQTVSVAGKTGTAKIGDRNNNGVIDDDEKPHSWFIGFASVDSPRIAIAVIAENQGLGAATAAPIAMDVMAEALNRI